ncbi:unnamed protein product [Cladocopium goreaui]|uniref:Enoyl reductase (ER) domain-containing protein n=1 Tax=Cladocopium goreaui TaxID=2562237 RepID=A0A9P1FZU4_9DINO|nr:unnamed protein product [Cladocopium goreaui]
MGPAVNTVGHGRWCRPAWLMDEVSFMPALQLPRIERLLTTNYSAALLSGAVAGSTTELILYLLDCLKSSSLACPKLELNGRLWPAWSSKMRAAVVTNRSWDFQFHLEKVAVMDVDIPTPGKGEVLVEVYASNINPVDHKIVEMAGWSWTYPHKLGYDVAGVVKALGSGCTRLKVGDEVWGEATSLMEAPTTAGTYAQYAVVSESVLGLKPKTMSMLEAGAMPMVALTGLESLTFAARGAGRFQSPNTTVLVLGGSGGTGHMGIQLAKDYHEQNYYDVLLPKSVDVIYDCVGQTGTGDHAFNIIKSHGSFVTLLQGAKASISTRLHRPDVREYAPTCVASLVEQGKLKVNIDQVFGLEDIVKAFNQSLSGHSTGKVALQIFGNATRKQSSCAPPKALQLYRGCGIALAGAATASAVFFVTYEFMKKRLLVEAASSHSQLSRIQFTCSVIGASVVGEVAASVVRVPIDLMKQRLQTGCHCLALPMSSSIVLASFQATALRDMCQSSLQYPLYECFKIVASNWVSEGDVNHLPVGVAAVCGSAAGLISATFTTPFDLIKTRVNLRKSLRDVERNKMQELIFEEVARVYRSDGLRGFFVGAGFRAAWMSLGGFVFLGSFELTKSRLDSLRS